MSKSNRSVKRINYVLIAICVIVFIGFGRSLFWSRLTNSENKQILITIMNNLQIGDPKEKVEQIYNKYKSRSLKLEKLDIDNEWFITMPYEFGATDWILWIEFENNKVISLKIRLSDSKDFKPKDSPLDKVK